MDNLLQLLTSKSETLAAKELEKALNEGFASLSKRTPIAPNPSDRQAYSDLKAYVDAGKDFPTTPAKFEEQAPQSVFQIAWKSLEDEKIYQETEDGLVAVGKSCKEFSDSSWLSKIIQDIENMTKETAEPKVQNIITELSITEPSKVNEIAGALETFRKETVSARPKVMRLITKYSKGPVKNTLTKNTPYLEYLKREQAKIVKVSDDVNEDSAKRTAATMMRSESAKLVDYVSEMVPKLGDINEKIKNAIQAVDTLGDIFDDLKKEYKGIDELLCETSKILVLELNARNREAMIKEEVRVVVNKAGELRDRENALLKAWKEITPAAAAAV